MGCDECDHEIIEVMSGHGKYAPYRIGTKELGYGTIVIIGCRPHVTLAINRLNEQGDIGDELQK